MGGLLAIPYVLQYQRLATMRDYNELLEVRLALLGIARSNPLVSIVGSLEDLAPDDLKLRIYNLRQRGFQSEDILPYQHRVALHEDEALPVLHGSMTANDMAQYVRRLASLLRADLAHLSQSTLDHTAPRHPYLDFSLARTLFCHIDYLGRLTGETDKDTENACAYLRRFVQPFSSTAAGTEVLMYRSFRHGAVHMLFPRELRAIIEHSDGRGSYEVLILPRMVSAWGAGSVVSIEITYESQSSPRTLECTLSVDLRLLGESLLKSMEGLAILLESADCPAEFLTRFQQAAQSLSSTRLTTSNTYNAPLKTYKCDKPIPAIERAIGKLKV